MKTESQKGRLADLLENEYGKLVSFVRKRIHDLAEYDAEDLVQDVALNIHNQADISAPIENFSAYVYSALRNAVVDVFRKRRSVASLDQPLPDTEDLSLADVILDSGYDSLYEMERKELIEELYCAMDALKEDERAVIIATEMEGRSFKDLAAQWGIPINTLLSRKSRGLKKIKTKWIGFERNSQKENP
jgi:RNA polymerase sigma factor (sigma-70 family)